MTSAAQSDGNLGAKFARFAEIMARLRAPDGCPWDREQTFDTLKPFLLEEAYEVLDAIDRRDWDELRGELGDVMLQAVFLAQLAREQGLFEIGDSIDAISDKLIRRHPHVFGDEHVETEGQVRQRWSEIKAQEKAAKGGAPSGLLDAVPRNLPALVEAQQITARAAQVGFDWTDVKDVLAKLDEERAELEAAVSPEEVEDEIGDLLFVVMNLARFRKVDAEQALRKSNAKFRARFAYIERALHAQGRGLPEASIEEMEALWQAAKR
ncbi:MAG TPA: nucleoside triphosphate pyrophosphohydrolase [Solibacterales bacterium]|nr:nucleoside triphosphate pyrophosphohydrolase [Bryobacterales bacterium]